MRVDLKPIQKPEMGHNPVKRLLPKPEGPMHTKQTETLRAEVKKVLLTPQSEMTNNNYEKLNRIKFTDK